MINIDLKGKRALVTGGSSGIGAAIVHTLARAGADVAVNYLEDKDGKDARAAAQVAKEAERHGVHAISLAANVDNAAEVERMFNALDQQLGGSTSW